LVCWERIVRVSSAIGWRCGSPTGRPYISRSRSRIATTRLRRGRVHRRLLRFAPGFFATVALASLAGIGRGYCPAVARIEEGTLVVEGTEVFTRRVEGEGPPAVFAHGNPGNSDDWLPFMERMQGPAFSFDFPGWGRSGRPRHGNTMHGLARFFDRLLAAAEIESHSLVVHDWGAVALLAAQRQPQRLERLVVINTVPLLPGYHWHFVARVWRRRGLGWTARPPRPRFVLERSLRLAKGDRGPMPRELVDSIYDHWDRGTARAILALYRSAPEPALAAAGTGLGRLSCPALVVWGGRDPYIGRRFGSQHAAALPDAELVELPAAGHWPWIDDPAVVERVVGFLEHR